MKNFKKLALVSLFASLIAGSTSQIFAASSSTSSSSSSSSSSEQDIATTEITCPIDPAILADKEKLSTCLQIMHLRARTVQTMYDRACHAQGQVDILSHSMSLQKHFSDAKESFEKINIDFYKEAEIVYSEAPQDVQQFIDHLEKDATLRIKQNYNIAQYPTYFNVANITKTKLLPSVMRKKFLWSAAGIAACGKILDFAKLENATYPYKHYLASVYRKLVDHYKQHYSLELPERIFALDCAYLTLSQDDLITLIELLQQHNAESIVNLLEKQISLQEETLKGQKASDTKARLQAQRLRNTFARVKESIHSFKKSFPHSAHNTAREYFCYNYALPDILNLFTNNIFLQYDIYYMNIIGILAKVYQVNASAVSELHYPPAAAKDILACSEKFDTLLGLETIQEPKKTDTIDDSWIEEIDAKRKGPRGKKGNNQRKKGKGSQKPVTKPASTKSAKKTQSSSVPSSSTSSSSSSSSTPATSTTPTSSERLLPITFKEQVEQEPVALLPIPMEEQSVNEDYIESEQENFIHLVDLARAPQGGQENSVFIYPQITLHDHNPLASIKLSQRTLEKSLRPCDNNHAFTQLVENYGCYAKLEKVEELSDGKCKCFYSMPGRIASLAYPAERAAYVGPNGYFEFIIIKATPASTGGTCTHRFFRPGFVAFPEKLDTETLA
ncbi:hypothetical protein K2W90_03405 [Candidatus Babeliales bacterium]|nr:hypothetical protein [Candidatus Babeliales bacterium]